jgi:hypothetical protein
MTLDDIQRIIETDIGQRGLRADPADNLLTACPDDFSLACRSIANTANAAVGIVTGFFIANATPPAAETDGPLGAIFLARALASLGIPVALFTDHWCRQALAVGIDEAGLKEVSLDVLPMQCPDWIQYLERTAQHLNTRFTHLIALERVGPSHTIASLQTQPGSTIDDVERFKIEVPAERQNRCHTMRGRDNSNETAPVHLMFEACREQRWLTTIGIGDGGNEIGMGKIPWNTIRHNIPNGGLIACRVATDYLVVSGISNWGAYGLATGIGVLRGQLPSDLFDIERERAILQAMISKGPLVDGVSGQPTLSVDGIPFARYIAPLQEKAAGLKGQ